MPESFPSLLAHGTSEEKHPSLRRISVKTIKRGKERERERLILLLQQWLRIPESRMEIIGPEMPRSLRCDILLGPAQDTAPDGVSDLRTPATWGWYACCQGTVSRRTTDFPPRSVPGVSNIVGLSEPREKCPLIQYLFL